MSKFVGDLDVRLLHDDKDETWELLAPFAFYSDELKSLIQAYQGFQTDFMSAPRVPVVYLTLGNRGRRLGVIHDLAYQTQMFPRKVCDNLILEMGPLCGFSWTEIWQVYVAVRMCGQSHYGDQKEDEPVYNCTITRAIDMEGDSGIDYLPGGIVSCLRG